MKQDGGAVTITSLLSFFENENKSVSRGEYHFKSNNVESFSASQGVFKRPVHPSMKKIVYNVTISEMRYMANIELKAYRKLLLNFVYYNFLFGYTLTETM